MGGLEGPQAPPGSGPGLLARLSAPCLPAGCRPGFTGTLRPGCLPINSYFLIPFAARRAAAPLPWTPASLQLNASGTGHPRLPADPAVLPQPRPLPNLVPVPVPVPAGRCGAGRCSQPGAPRLSRAELVRAGLGSTGQVP